MIRLLIVAGQPALTQGLRMRLAAEPDLSVVGESEDCGVALKLVQSLSPDVVIVDLDGPHGDRVGVARTLRTICKRVPVIILSMHADTLEKTWADRTDVAAFVAKFQPVEVLLMSIRGVACDYESTGLTLGTVN